jgi:hypothetical protein
MDALHCAGAICAACIVFWGAAVQADDDSPVALSLDYQQQRLLAPTPAQRAMETRGGVYIYDSLEAGEVDAALDQHFGRIQNMMFIRIHHLPPNGTGPAEVEDDDCV